MKLHWIFGKDTSRIHHVYTYCTLEPLKQFWLLRFYFRQPVSWKIIQNIKQKQCTYWQALLRGCLGLLCSINSSSAPPTPVWSSSTVEFHRWPMCLACSPAPALGNWDFGGKCLLYPLNDVLIYLMDKSVLFVRFSSTFNKIDLKSNHITPIVFKASLRRRLGDA
jgi:hypothetical protein